MKNQILNSSMIHIARVVIVIVTYIIRILVDNKICKNLLNRTLMMIRMILKMKSSNLTLNLMHGITFNMKKLKIAGPAICLMTMIMEVISSNSRIITMESLVVLIMGTHLIYFRKIQATIHNRIHINNHLHKTNSEMTCLI